MFRFNCVLLTLVLILVAAPGFAQTPDQKTVDQKTSNKKTAVKQKPFTYIDYTTIALSFVSWGESVRLTQGALTDRAHANLLGNSILLEWEHYFQPRLGWILRGSYLFGVADVGGTQSQITYQQSNESWWGAESSVRLGYRLSKWIIGTTGPMGLYRELALPDSPAGVSATSGSTFNVGWTADLRMRLINSIEVREEIGFLLFAADTYWTLGAGYKF